MCCVRLRHGSLCLLARGHRRRFGHARAFSVRAAARQLGLRGAARLLGRFESARLLGRFESEAQLDRFGAPLRGELLLLE